jgi:glutamyl-tRNA synthetase
VGDVVLRRADGFLAYHLATAVDELALGITDVVRGNDLWSATAPQVAVMRELDAAPPRYWHLPLWRDDQGRRLSKRDGGCGLDSLSDQGLDPPAVVGLMAASLRLVPTGSRLSSAELLQHCSLQNLQAALTRPAEGLRKASGSNG